jgi:hypothetical protein
MTKIDKVQSRAQKSIHGSNACIEKQKKIMTVEMQLRYTDLLFFKKCETGDIDCDMRERLEPRRATRSQNNSTQDLLQPAAPARTTGLAEQAFAFRVVGPWNNLPYRLKDCSANKFPALCKPRLWQSFNVLPVT